MIRLVVRPGLGEWIERLRETPPQFGFITSFQLVGSDFSKPSIYSLGSLKNSEEVGFYNFKRSAFFGNLIGVPQSEFRQRGIRTCPCNVTPLLVQLATPQNRRP